MKKNSDIMRKAKNNAVKSRFVAMRHRIHNRLLHRVWRQFKFRRGLCRITLGVTGMVIMR